MIHIDQQLTARDLFRVSLELSKVRLLIGGAIVMLVIGATVWFFRLIGEGFFLLELSPLFIGFPLLGLGGQVLRLHATCRKYFRKLPESHRRIQYHFQEDSDGYDVIYGDNFSHCVWKDVSRVIEKRDYFIFSKNELENWMILKKGFHQPADITLFRQIVSQKLGSRAKLLAAA